MSFDERVSYYYYASFEISDADAYVIPILILWTLVKLVFYVIPIMQLMRARDREQSLNCSVETSIAQRLVRSWSIWLLLVPVIDCFVYFYIIVTLIGRTEGLNSLTKQYCIMYGLSAGILNILSLYHLEDTRWRAASMTIPDNALFSLYLSVAVFMAWCLISAVHLFYVYGLIGEIKRNTPLS